MCEIVGIDAMELLPRTNTAQADALLQSALSRQNHKIVVLDDDPTGVQTVHGVNVYTDWTHHSIEEGFAEESTLFFILTNTRSMGREEAREVNQEIALRILDASIKYHKPFVLVSRSDSTLRGHYPLETETLRDTIEHNSEIRYDGEIICPFFREGGRLTLKNVHYVREGKMLVPAAMTEFAKDKTFGYHHSHLGKWCEEKTASAYQAKDMAYVSLECLRSGDSKAVTELLMGVHGFQKVIVNAAEYADVQVFLAGYLGALDKGKQFIFRSAAAIPKLLGGISDRPLLRRADIVQPDLKSGGIILVGSHVQKTTLQLKLLQQAMPELIGLEFDVCQALVPGGLLAQAQRVAHLAEDAVAMGKTARVYTSRKRLDLAGADEEEQLRVSVRISDAVTSVIAKLKTQPAFIIAKGGITSSDVGTKALRVRRALVMGQVAPGVPVWKTDEQSKFAGMPYVIFPGNVGETRTLLDVVKELCG
ncbi:MAG: hydroxyacid dehydrogenase [Clostridiales bacterium]|nr:hydroxyacid dehydrogenase [Clostridiales bacterium]